MKKSEFNDMLTDDEKQRLRIRILQSVRLFRSRKRKKWSLMVAASLVFLIGIGILFLVSTRPSIEDYVKAAPEFDAQHVEGVTLILGSGENLNLDEENAYIQYSDTGEEVNLGSGKTVNQKSVSNDKLIFNTILVPYGKRTDLRLSDGTMVWLNSGSKLTYPVVFKGKNREVYLEGEAIFEVTHNAQKPFKVLSSDQEIEVLGTVFNVSNYKDDELIFTVLKSGSVNINYSNKTVNPVKLKPGSMASYNLVSSEAITQAVNVDDYFSWRDAFLKFKKNSLKSIMAKLSRYYNVDIVIENQELANQTFSGNLDLKEDIENVISLIRETSNFKMDYSSDGRIVITNQN